MKYLFHPLRSSQRCLFAQGIKRNDTMFFVLLFVIVGNRQWHNSLDWSVSEQESALNGCELQCKDKPCWTARRWRFVQKIVENLLKSKCLLEANLPKKRSSNVAEFFHVFSFLFSEFAEWCSATSHSGTVVALRRPVSQHIFAYITELEGHFDKVPEGLQQRLATESIEIAQVSRTSINRAIVMRKREL